MNLLMPVISKISKLKNKTKILKAYLLVYIKLFKFIVKNFKFFLYRKYSIYIFLKKPTLKKMSDKYLNLLQ